MSLPILLLRLSASVGLLVSLLLTFHHSRGVEIHITIMCSSMPACSTFIKHVYGHAFHQSNRHATKASSYSDKSKGFAPMVRNRPFDTKSPMRSTTYEAVSGDYVELGEFSGPNAQPYKGSPKTSWYSDGKSNGEEEVKAVGGATGRIETGVHSQCRQSTGDSEQPVPGGMV